ncbi:MAG: glycerophosphodiester phosphodiesterase family protein [Cocleimonas sp.]
MDANKLVAHRGDNTNYPENSYAGIESALRAGALFIEFDVQMNADKSLVVIHDTDFKRTANNPAYLFALGDAKTHEISVHEPHQFGEQHYPTYTATLADIMTLFAKYPKSHALVEVKRESLWQWGVNAFMKPFLTLLKEHQAQSTVISFGLDALEYTKKHSTLRTGFVFYDYHTSNFAVAKKLKPDYMIISHTILPEETLWEGDWQWIVYSLNNLADAKKIIQRDDVDMIETDDIVLLLE